MSPHSLRGKRNQANGIVYHCINCNKIVKGKNRRCKSCSKRGDRNPQFNKELSQQHKERISKSLKKNIEAINKLKNSLLNKRSRAWKGCNIGYHGGHWRINKTKGKPKICSICRNTEKKTYHWANLSGKWYDFNDYLRLCHSCHKKIDYTILNDNWYKKWLGKKSRILQYKNWFIQYLLLGRK